jgi:hypothetical protein
MHFVQELDYAPPHGAKLTVSFRMTLLVSMFAYTASTAVALANAIIPSSTFLRAITPSLSILSERGRK